MRIQVRIPAKTWDQLSRLSQREHRPPKHQVELLLWRAIEQAIQNHDAPQLPQEVPCGTE